MGEDATRTEKESTDERARQRAPVSPGEWRSGAARGAQEWHRLLAADDRSFGNVAERNVRDVELLLADGSAWETYADDRLVGVALAIPDRECLVRVTSDHPARANMLGSGVLLVQEHLRRGAPWWIPSGDAEAEHVAGSHGLALSYRDLQMRLDTASARRTSPPEATRLRDFDASPAALRDVHDLVCRAWGVADHWPAFLDRFAGAALERHLWVQLESRQGELLAACFGDVQDVGDGRVGVVRHLDVAPGARRRGLGSWALNELVARFAEAGRPQAQLGVHDDNASAAPALYSALGWRVVSSQGKWIQAS